MPTVGHATPRRALIAVGTLMLVIQLASARWLVANVETPNAGREIAERLAAGEGYTAAYGTRLWGPRGATREPPRAYVLPAEPLYLAALFRLTPRPLHRFAHVAVTTLLVVAVAAFAASIGGAELALVTGVLAALQPFVVVHGPVWDDTFLAAAFVWLVLAIVMHGAASSAANQKTAAARTQGLLVLALASGIASLARLEAQLILLLLGGAIWVTPRLRGLRRESVAMAAGVLVALGGWGWRNQTAVGTFFVGSTRDGLALWESNGPVARKAIRRGQVMTLSMDAAIMRAHWDSTAGMSEAEANGYFRRAAVRYAMRHPIDVAGTAALKLVISLSGIRPELPLAAPRNLAAMLSNALLIALALWGAASLRAGVAPEVRAALGVVLGIVVVVGVAMLLAGPIGLRYRITLDGVLWLAAAAGVERVWRGASDAQRAGVRRVVEVAPAPRHH